MSWYWIVLALWYVALVYVIVWNRRSRPVWRHMAPYPLATKVWIFVPFSHRWRGQVDEADHALVAPFRRRAMFHTYVVVLLPPILIFGWLYGSTWLRIDRADERRYRLEREAERLIDERRP